MTDAEKIDRIARARCAERCGGSEKPCLEICEGPGRDCGQDADCYTIASVALKATEE